MPIVEVHREADIEPGESPFMRHGNLRYMGYWMDFE